MMRQVLRSLIASSMGAVGFLACNSLLDNQRGDLVEVGGEAVAPSPREDASTVPADEPAASGAAADTSAPEAGKAPSTDCPVGQQACAGTCVSMTDPRYGCGAPSCSPCRAAHATMGCLGVTCVVTGCDPGYANCNLTPGDGCETDLSKPMSCGGCNAPCGAAAPQCVPSGTTFQCSNGCTPAAPVACGAECVDPLTSVNHCGGCNVKCPDVADATPACTAGVCTFTCKETFRACGGKCVAKTDPTACGPACTPCPVIPGGIATCVADTCGVACVPPSRVCAGKCTAPTDPTACGPACVVCPAPANAAATCAANLCAFTCNPGFGNCDGNPMTGCEATLASDPLNCGKCGKACGIRACVNGDCQAQPPPPPP